VRADDGALRSSSRRRRKYGARGGRARFVLGLARRMSEASTGTKRSSLEAAIPHRSDGVASLEKLASSR